MPSSSAFAAPLDLDLRPGRMEPAARVLMLALALWALALSDLPPTVQAAAVLLGCLMFVADVRRAARRGAALRLHVDGSVEAGSQDAWLPARLVQASQFCGLWQVRWTSAGSDHASLLFPDRVDPAARQRLRVWLATHQPQPVAGGVAA